MTLPSVADEGDASKSRRRVSPRLLRLLLRAAAAVGCLALAFTAGHAYASSSQRSTGAAVDPAVDACAWPAAFRPLQGQEWLDAAVIDFSHPLLPTGSVARVYATKRAGASYAPHREFWATVADGTWEPTTFRIMRGILGGSAVGRGRGGTHWDIGGWVGPTTLFAAHYASRVVALEPDPRAFSELLGNVRLNAPLAAAARVAPYRHCLAARDGRVEMTGPVPAGTEKNWGARMASWDAECSTPATFAARAGLAREELRMVKVDVEGAEAVIVPLLVEWLGDLRRRPAILVELHTQMWDDPVAHANIAAALATFEFVYISGRLVAPRRARPADVRALRPRGGVCKDGVHLPRRVLRAARHGRALRLGRRQRRHAGDCVGVAQAVTSRGVSGGGSCGGGALR